MKKSIFSTALSVGIIAFMTCRPVDDSLSVKDCKTIIGDGVGLLYFDPPIPNDIDPSKAQEWLDEQERDAVSEFNQRHGINSQPTFEDLLDAICQVESGCNADVVGDSGRAVGAYQLHKIYVDEVNRLISKLRLYDKPYSYADRWDKVKSRRMVQIFILHYGGIVDNCEWTAANLLEAMARIHNGGPNGWKKESTKEYWKKVEAELYK